MAIKSNKPILVVTAFNASGHTAGLMQISEYLIKRGFQIYFVAGPTFKASIEALGAVYIENPFVWDDIYASAPAGADATWDIKHIFGASVPTAHRVLKETLERVRREHPTRQVIIVHEALSGGLGPFVYGAPLPKGYDSLPKVINFHTTIYAAADENLPPFGLGLPYDPTPENLALWQGISQQMVPVMTDVLGHYNDIYASLGATRPLVGPFFDIILGFGNATVMATTPSLEYPISHPDPTLRLIGGLPLKPLPADYAHPAWWPTITANAALPSSSEKKKLVFVTQGTIHRDYTEIIMPTLTALSERSDLLVVATLGARGATLPDTFPVPSNAIVADYLPYDAILPHAEVFVSNAGYGGFMQGVMNGVPMVLAGTMADKAEVAARAEWAGVAVNLRAQRPEGVAIMAGVDKVLGDGGYKKRAVELRAENEGMEALVRFERIVEELVERE
ncbi:glycosyltransferase [Staphylotrichum tortipilum]|uniref:Glycosyltransferase n=1 Tax=Staphylotrichum tortipilum TaxID=2831512 RepID=A0AAN6MS94_9PEZI|nr:glycosyltransferase [Staphylotrichum longicolle]